MFHNRRSPAGQARPSLTVQCVTPPARTQINTNLSCNLAPSLFDFRHSARRGVPFAGFIVLENWKWTLAEGCLQLHAPVQYRVAGVLGVLGPEGPGTLGFTSVAAIVVLSICCQWWQRLLDRPWPAPEGCCFAQWPYLSCYHADHTWKLWVSEM